LALAASASAAACASRLLPAAAPRARCYSYEIGTSHFATGTAAITPEGKATLDRAAAAMKTHPEARLRIEGFTDSTGPAALNDVLSQQRALAAANYLKAEGIEGSRLTGEGFGPDDPAGDNAGSSGRADNRRAELFVSH
jgi:OOP family OmpA-OmpF porin